MHLRIDPLPGNTGGGEQRAEIPPPRMPGSDRACRLENKLA